ncbi:MAG: alpha/beta fold hydrolase [Microthrixaceae bacterium]
MADPGSRAAAVVDGLSVRRWRSSSPTDTCVVLVHGAMDRGASFSRVVRRLEGVDVVVYDRRGYGESQVGGARADRPATLAQHAQDLVGVTHWCDAEHVVVVGHSIGGTVALLASNHPDAVCAALATYESPLPPLPGYRSDLGDAALVEADRAGDAAAAEHFYRSMIGDATWDRLRDPDRNARRAEGRALVGELRSLRDTPVDVAGPDVPLIVGVGGGSGAYFASQAIAQCAAAGLDEPMVLAGAGHGAHLSHPGEFARFVDAVRTQVPSP